ncbi:CbaC protein [Halosolutus amylolyticus]|uniref:CbaC protein n=1 Tax=Halosolutus amylolyticus TaxID=2932267 RepID=A0ABD5PTS9_9EURY|nr:CbaC protein [Halosolutus amylolyticus]
MRTTLPRLFLVIAILVVLIVELRTALAFFGVQVSFTTTIVAGVVVTGLVVLWAVIPTDDRSGG